MPRGPRTVMPEFPHHVIHRGNNRQAIFHRNTDYRFFMNTISEAKKEFNCLLYGYCLMSNHIHMIIQPSHKDSLSKMIKMIAGRYTRYINKVYNRTGTIWEGRFKSSPIQKESYLQACIRYIEMNPLRAKIVADLKEYPWSSYNKRAYGKSDPILDIDPYYLELGKTNAERINAYRTWFNNLIPKEELDCIKVGVERSLPIGSGGFSTDLSKRLGMEIGVRPRGRPRLKK